MAFYFFAKREQKLFSFIKKKGKIRISKFKDYDTLIGLDMRKGGVQVTSQ